MAVSDFRVFTGTGALMRMALVDLDILARRDGFWKRGVKRELAKLFQSDSGGLVLHRDGSWAVVELYENDADERVFFVLGAYCRSSETFREGAAYFEAVARHMGCQRIRFGSFRKGWRKRAARMGYQRDGEEYYVRALA